VQQWAVRGHRLAISGHIRVSYKCHGVVHPRGISSLFSTHPLPLPDRLPHLLAVLRLQVLISRPFTFTTLEMALLKRQSGTFEVFDDQGPTLSGSMVGNWTHVPYTGFYNNTITGTPTPGASFVFTFSGMQTAHPLNVFRR